MHLATHGSFFERHEACCDIKVHRRRCSCQVVLVLSSLSRNLAFPRLLCCSFKSAGGGRRRQPIRALMSSLRQQTHTCCKHCIHAYGRPQHGHRKHAAQRQRSLLDVACRSAASAGELSSPEQARARCTSQHQRQWWRLCQALVAAGAIALWCAMPHNTTTLLASASAAGAPTRGCSLFQIVAFAICTLLERHAYAISSIAAGSQNCLRLVQYCSAPRRHLCTLTMVHLEMRWTSPARPGLQCSMLSCRARMDHISPLTSTNVHAHVLQQRVARAWQSAAHRQAWLLASCTPSAAQTTLQCAPAN